MISLGYITCSLFSLLFHFCEFEDTYTEESSTVIMKYNGLSASDFVVAALRGHVMEYIFHQVAGQERGMVGLMVPCLSTTVSKPTDGPSCYHCSKP